MPPTRVLVYGVTGSGKTTLARRIADATGLPFHEVDAMTWDPGWRQVPDEEQRRRVAAVCEKEAWILDSAYGKWLDVVLPHVHVIVGLDYPRWMSFGRLLRRTLARVIDRQPVCNGNQESLRLMLSRESILLWHLRSFGSKRRRMRAWEAAPPEGVQVIRFVHPRDAEAWVRRLTLADGAVSEPRPGDAPNAGGSRPGHGPGSG